MSTMSSSTSGEKEEPEDECPECFPCDPDNPCPPSGGEDSGGDDDCGGGSEDEEKDLGEEEGNGEDDGGGEGGGEGDENKKRKPPTEEPIDGGLPVALPVLPEPGGPPTHQVLPVSPPSSGRIKHTILPAPHHGGTGLGSDLVHSRVYGSRLTRNDVGQNGNSWLVSSLPYLVFDGASPGQGNSSKISMVKGLRRSLYFELSGGSYVARFGMKATLEHAGQEFVLTYPNGRKLVFYDNGTEHSSNLVGKLKKKINRHGRETIATYDGQGKITKMEQSSTDSSRVAGLYYTYDGSSGLLIEVLKAITVSGVQTPQRRVVYTYFDGSNSAGSANDLRTATIEQWNGIEWQQVRKNYHRYYVGSEPDGFKNGLKFVVDAEGYERMVEAGLNPEDEANVTDEDVAQYAVQAYEYDSNRRLKKKVTSSGAIENDYERFYSAPANPGGTPPNWHMETIRTRKDGSEVITYQNAAFQTMLKILKSGTDEWFEYYEYDSNNRMTLKASSEAVASINDPSMNEDLVVTLHGDKGLITTYEFYPDTGGGSDSAPGYLKNEQVKKGSSGTPITLRELKYTGETVGNQTVYKIKERTVYQSESGGGSDPASTKYEYQYFSGTFQLVQMITKPPVVPTSQNGDGEQYERVDRYDEFGNLTWAKDELGYISYREYEETTGALIRQIWDVDTSNSQLQDVPAGWVTPAGGGLHLQYDYESDSLGRTTQELGPSHEVDISGAATQVRRAKYWVYLDDRNQLHVAQGYEGQGGGFNTMGPVSIFRFDFGGRLLDQVQATRDPSGRISESDAYPQSKWSRWTSMGYDNKGRQLYSRAYFEIPSSSREVDGKPSEGLEGVDYNETRFGYDTMDRPNYSRSPGGTIGRTVYDVRGLSVSNWVGTNDTGATDSEPSNGGEGGNNMVAVILNEYDGAAAGGNGNLSERRLPVDGSSSNDRVTEFEYDFRNRQVSASSNSDASVEIIYEAIYNNLNRSVEQRQYKGPSASKVLIRKSKAGYDNRDRLYNEESVAVNPDSGAEGNVLRNDSWFDPAGQLIRSRPAGSNISNKTVYDGVGRVTNSFASYPSGADQGDTNDVTDDIVLEQLELSYDPASNMLQSVASQRFDDAAGTGSLNGPNGTQPKGREIYTAFWLDPIGRNIGEANYGTNGSASFVRPSIVPARSDTVLVSTRTYKSDGDKNSVTDPNGVETRWESDKLGRQIELIDNFQMVASSPDANRTTRYRYNADGRLEVLTLKNAVTGDQVTRWKYGTTLVNAAIATGQLLRAKISPDSDDADGDDGADDRIEYTYNRQGEVVGTKDQNETEHAYGYDKFGRLTSDSVTLALGSGIDDGVLRIERSYEARGMLESVTSFDAVSGGNVVNDVKFSFDDFGQLESDQQAHNGPVDGNTPEVRYGYADGSTNTARRTSLTYPNGRQLDYSYGTGGGANDEASRIESLRINGESSDAVRYNYVGLDRYVKIEYPEPGAELTYIKQGSEPVGDAGDRYTGYDRFGRTVDMRWIKQSDGSELDRIQYGYDRASNRIWRENPVAVNGGQDEHYGYDGLYQVTSRQRGDLDMSRSSINGTPVEEEGWVYDSAGNWDEYETKANGTTTLDQSRTQNRVNELTQIDESAIGLAYDKAGNATQFLPDKDGDWSKEYELKWDAWNRLVKVEDGSGAIVATYTYDGQYRRTTKTIGGSTRHFYYSDQWKILEERIDGSTTPENQNVWGVREGHRDDLVLRDRSTTGTLNERMYSVTDYFSATAIIDTNAVVEERYGYTAFGVRRVMDPSFQDKTDSTFDWVYGFQGQFLDEETGYYNYGYRCYVPYSGRWPNRDPIEEESGVNLYWFVANRSLNVVDFLGLDGCCVNGKCVGCDKCCLDELAARTAAWADYDSELDALKASEKEIAKLKAKIERYTQLISALKAVAITACRVSKVAPPCLIVKSNEATAVNLRRAAQKSLDAEKMNRDNLARQVAQLLKVYEDAVQEWENCMEDAGCTVPGGRRTIRTRGPSSDFL